MSKILFVTGLSGAGKTSLGEYLKQENHFVHFNVDVWAFGGNPITESNMVPNPEMMSKRDPEIKALFDDMTENGFKKLIAGEDSVFESWTRFFDRLLPDIHTAYQQATSENQHLVVSFSVYLKSVRDYIRQQCQTLFNVNVYFVILQPNIHTVAHRKIAHLRNTAAARNLTLSQFLRSFNPNSDAPELSEEAIEQIFNAQTESSAKGFEGQGTSELHTLSLPGTSSEKEMTVEEERDAVLAFFAH